MTLAPRMPVDLRTRERRVVALSVAAFVALMVAWAAFCFRFGCDLARQPPLLIVIQVTTSAG